MIKYILNKVISKLAGEREYSKLLVFNFHNITNTKSSLLKASTDFEAFKKQVEWIHHHFEVLPLDDGIHLSRSAKLDRPTACITLDDGYKSQHELAKPIFDKFNIPATFFVSSGHFKGLLWNDHVPLFFNYANDKQKESLIKKLNQLTGETVPPLKSDAVNLEAIEILIKYLPLYERTDLLSYMFNCIPQKAIEGIMFSEDDVQDIASSNHIIGAHTVNHPILSLEKNETAYNEIQKDIDFLQKLIDKPVSCFAYPNGKPQLDYSDREIQILLDCDVKYAATTQLGYFSPGSDPMQIPRVNLSGEKPLKYYRTVISAYRHHGTIVESRGYEKTC